MAKAIGLSRNIKLKWLDKAVELFNENLTEADFKNKMNDYLSFEIESATNLRKTREILMNLWYYPISDDVVLLRKEANNLLKNNSECTYAIHWGILLLVYPVFSDLCKFIGRFSELSDTVVLSQLKKKLYDEWGERTTLHHSTDKIIATMKELGAIYSEKPGKYKIVKCNLRNKDLITYLVRIAMKTTGKSYYSITELDNMSVLFPFNYKVSKEWLIDNDNYLVTNFGGAESYSLK